MPGRLQRCREIELADNPRIEELRRRVQKEPASIAFAQLAEELRRSDRFLEAVEACRAGLEMYPGYLSVRVTLGRCLVELDRLDEAEQELEQVRVTAPENLAAIRALSKIQQRRRAVDPQYGSAGIQSAGDIRLKPDVTDATGSDVPPGTGVSPASAAAPDHADLKPITSFIDKLHHVEVPTTRRARTVSEDEYIQIIRTLTALEAWLAAINVARAGRSA
jgi:tetratricopeptide (TPR) repeat protein